MSMQRMRSSAAVAAIACLAIALGGGARGAVAGGPKPTATPPPAPTSWIYAANRSTGGNLAVSPDGESIRQVPCGGDWSAGSGSKRVLRVEEVPGQTFPVWWHRYGIVQRPVRSIVVRDDACGGAQIMYTAPSGTWLDVPSWSLDGRRIAFHAEEYDAQGLMVRNGVFEGDVDGSCGPGLCHVHLVTSLPLIETYRDEARDLVEYQSSSILLSWSADGRTVVYARSPDANGATGGIFTADMGAFGRETATSEEVRVPLDQASQPLFSPVDPDVIAVVVAGRHNATRANDLALTTRAGGTYQLVTTGTNFTGASISQYAWSPDGVWFAFDAWNKGLTRDEVWKIRPGAAKATLVLSTAGTFYTVAGWR